MKTITKQILDTKGMERVLNPAALCESFQFRVVKLQASAVLTPQNGESVVVVLSGSARVLTPEAEHLIGRRLSVFDGHAEGFYIPAGTQVAVKPLTKPLVLALAVSNLPPKTKGLTCLPLLQKDTVSRQVGRYRYSRRVIDVLTPSHKADYFLVGETYTPCGHWSSYPPHKHDTSIEGRENKMEEVYFYQSKLEHKLAFQGLYRHHDREGFLVSHNDCVHIREGYHPFASSPESDFYYLWILHGRKRLLKYTTDPRFLS